MTLSHKIIQFGLAAMLLSLSFSVEAQQPKINRVGVLLPGEHWTEIIEGLRAGLKELQLQEGKQFILEIRDTKGDLKAATCEGRLTQRPKVNHEDHIRPSSDRQPVGIHLTGRLCGAGIFTFSTTV